MGFWFYPRNQNKDPDSAKLRILCSTYHAGGANVCAPGEPDSVRTLAALGYKIGYLRQEENQYLANDHEVMKKLPMEVQALAGWGIALPMS